MELVEDNPGKKTLDDIKKVDKELYPFFDQYVDWGGKSYFAPFTETSGEPLSISQHGVEHLDKLRNQLAQLKFQQRQVEISKMIAFTGAGLLTISLMGLVVERGLGIFNLETFQGKLLIAAAAFLALVFIFVIREAVRSFFNMLISARSKYLARKMQKLLKWLKKLKRKISH